MARRRRSSLPGSLPRALFGIVAVVVVIAALGVAAAMLLIDPNRFKPDLEAAARRATGHEISLRGKLHIGLGLPPTLVADDIAVANPPGGSRPDMLTLQQLSARVALLPLLSGEVDVVRLDLIRPDLLLETDAAGHGNWRVLPADHPKPAPANAGAAPSGGGRVSQFALQALHIIDGHVAWHDGGTGRDGELSLPRLDAEGGGPDSSLVVSGEVVSAGHKLTLTGETGSISRLLDRAAETPWLVQVVAKNDSMRLAANGSFVHPLLASGYTLQVDATATDLTTFAPVLPPNLPPLHDLSLSALLTDAGGAAPRVGKIVLHVGQFPLPAHSQIDIVRADVTAPSLDKPMHADIQASYAGAPLHLVSDGGSLEQLRPGTAPGAPEPLSLTIEAGGAALSAKGSAALLPLGRGDVDVALSARVPDLAALSALAGRTLPSLRQITFEGHLSGDLGGALALRKARLTMPQAQMTGDLDLVRAPRPSIRGAVQVARIDLDGLLAGVARAGTSGRRRAAADRRAGAAGAGATPPAKPDKAARMIPDEPFDLAGLSRQDVDLQLSITQLQTGGASYGDIAGHLALQDGKLALDPFSGQTPGGHLDAKLTIDATAPEPPMSVALHAPSLALQPLSGAFGAPDAVAGTAWIDMDLHGVGRNPRALAATLDGHFGLAVADADIDNGTLGILLGAVLKTAKFPESVLGGPGQTRLRCLAARLDAAHGVVAIPVLVADATRLVVQGGGGFDLGQETLNLHLRPLLRAGPGIEVPVRVGGTFREPKSPPTRGREGLASLIGAHGGDSCGAALAAVRGPDAPPLAPLAPPGKPPKTIDLLRGLLH